jgi:serine/threonine-protein kinase
MPTLTHLGKYRIERELGRGGYATVYQAYDPTLDRRVALKVPHATYLADAEFVARFRREALTAARLSHPNIVTIHEIGEQDGTPFIVMELLEGAGLPAWLAQNRADLAANLRLLEGIAAALDFAHGRGVIHRDIKPANVIVVPNRGAVLTDFGIARAYDATAHSLSAKIGTPRYMAPEQAEGRPQTAACDIYGFGVLLYEVLTGRPPFTADTSAAILHQHVHATPPEPCSLNPNLPAAAGKHLLEALAKDPTQRPKSARALVGCCWPIWQGSRGLARPGSRSRSPADCCSWPR